MKTMLKLSESKLYQKKLTYVKKNKSSFRFQTKIFLTPKQANGNRTIVILLQNMKFP